MNLPSCFQIARVGGFQIAWGLAESWNLLWAQCPSNFSHSHLATVPAYPTHTDGSSQRQLLHTQGNKLGSYATFSQ